MTNDHTTQPAQAFAAIDIGTESLNATLATPLANGEVRFQTYSAIWRAESATLNSENGLLELAAGFKRLVGELRLSNTPACLALSGDYCVTRVVTGSEDLVRHELAELEQRSALYLSLGHGPKVLAGCVRHTDARNRHALLSVINKNTLHSIIEAAQRAGLKIQRLEPSLISLCRFIGRLDADGDEPVLVAHVGQRSVELGISHQGRLLLDYRPAGIEQPQQLASVVAKHLGRLQRYCDRYVRFAQGKLQTIYLSGPPEEVQSVANAFAELDVLRVHPLADPWQVDSNWHAEGSAPHWGMAAPLGLFLLNQEVDIRQAGPNLMARVQDTTRQSLAHLLRPLFWPMAASLLLAAVGWGAVWHQSSRCQQLEQKLNVVEVAARDARLQQVRIERAAQMIASYQRLHAELDEVSWSQLASYVAQCLPQDVWLESLKVETDGRLVLTGGSFSDDGVFEFVKWLSRVPQLQRVALDGTRPARFAAGSGTSFDVHCEIINPADQEDNTDERG